MINILDRYIMRQFLGTLIFMLVLLIAIFLVVDIQGHYQNYSENNFTILDTLIQYYPYYIIWAINVFASILVFISAVYFTSRITNNTEVVAITSSGVSFFRFSRPYLYVAILIAGASLINNHFLLPWANIKKNEFNVKTLIGNKKIEYNSNRQISSKISPNEYLFVNSYSRVSKSGDGFLYQKFDENKNLIHQLRARSINWSDADQTYQLRDYFERTISPSGKETLKSGDLLKKKFGFTPDELLPESFVAETMNTPELLKFIKQEKMKGSENVNTYLNELYQRTSAPVAVIILTFLALSLSSTKKRGGLGLNLAIGIVCAFAFIFSFEALKIISSKGTIPSLLAVWLPNLVFGIVTVILYFKRAFA